MSCLLGEASLENHSVVAHERHLPQLLSLILIYLIPTAL